MNKDQLLSLARTSLKVIGAGLVQQGYLSNQELLDIMGMVSMASGIFWSHSVHAAPQAPKAQK
jgi:hypothetical protein